MTGRAVATGAERTEATVGEEDPLPCRSLLAAYRAQRTSRAPRHSFLDFELESLCSVHTLTAPFRDETSLPVDDPEHALIAVGLSEAVQRPPRHPGEELTIYNITRPVGSSQRIAGRVELRGSERSVVMFFEPNPVSGKWRRVPCTPVLPLQDPFHTECVHGFHILGGVQTYTDSKSGRLQYRTLFFRYRESVDELVEAYSWVDPEGETRTRRRLAAPFAIGPEGMKDIRLVELPNGRIAVFTRPQGGAAGPGRVGYLEMDRLEDLTPSRIQAAPIVPGLFAQGEWGGVNEAHLLRNGKVGILGHVAEEVPLHAEERHGRWVKNYYPITFCFDPATRQVSGVQIVATAEDFDPVVEPKHDRLRSVVFSGGLERHADGSANLWCGIGDVRAGQLHLPVDPFLAYERA